MVQMKHLIPYPTIMKISGKLTTMPGMAVTPSIMIQQMRAGSFEERTIAQYDREGYELPDFSRMDKLQRLQALNVIRDQVLSQDQKLTELHAKKKASDDSIKEDQKIAAAVDLAIKKSQKTASNG